MPANGNIGLSLVVIVLGAICVWGVKFVVAGIDISAIGIILLIAGTAGLALSMLFWSSFSPFARRTIVTEVDVETPPRP